ncbi:proline iminopeptidase-family hydrolase [Flavihumibacter petaseus]|uniref:Proline iminopeptidase n=1 Tax=Flavihumibacter petaseus NBRC 106054 TaxID=1220578 RepID=A0A0E9N6V8_9BACT|nr:proline iminopeptidase-family hydrolase [Flavihumibacter petaseus]GAO45426.1 proline iminopeptidase [Flavihumibacter petaseus NBRC 106054]
MKLILSTMLIAACLFSCKQASTTADKSPADTSIKKPAYFDYSGSDDHVTGGIKMIPISTPKGTFKVWTKRVGNNPTIKVLLLHGGPGGTHEFFENFDGYLPNEGIEYIYYDQLDSYYSDKPNDSTLWTTQHFVEEVEQVRKALKLDKDNFYLLGQSWGGLLAMEYALKYQQNLKGLIISNMMASIPEYEKYAREVLAPQLPPEVWKEIAALEAKGDFQNPRYSELLMKNYYTEHVVRKPLEEWPEFINRAFSHLNPKIYVYMQGYSEFGVTGNATLKHWDVSGRLKEISVPTLMIGGKYDTMDPKYMEWMSKQVQHGRNLTVNAGHCAQYDDPENYFGGLIKFLKDVANNQFTAN